MRIALRGQVPPSPHDGRGIRRVFRPFRWARRPLARDVFQLPPIQGPAAGADGREQAWRVDVPGVAESVPHLRRWVRLPLSDDAELADAFELIISEYGTNALRHSASGVPGGRIKAGLACAVQHVRLAVLDGGGPAANTTRASEELTEHGRGLVLAGAYADECGRFDTLDGRTSWALINR